jgi:hypothetical protein
VNTVRFENSHVFTLCVTGERGQDKSVWFWKIRWQLFHMALVHIFKHFGDTMEVPEVTKCHDGLFRQVLYSLAAYIADYPEQVLLTCIVQGWCPRLAYVQFRSF